MSIMEKAEKLGQEIANSSEYEKLVDAEQVMHQDEEAKDLLEDFQSVQKRMKMAQANGQQPGPSQQQKLQTIQSQMQENEKIKDYMEAQKQFNEVMKTVNDVITSQLQDENNQ